MNQFNFKIAYRNLKKSKLITVGSITTLFYGVLSISLLFSYVYNELTMDKFHSRHKDIYMTIIRASPESNWEAIESSFFFKFDYATCPELESATFITKLRGNQTKLWYEKVSFESEGIATDSNFFKLFDFKLIVGNEQSVLSDNNTILLTENLSKKIFRKENPLGKTIKLQCNFDKEYTVNGIIENPPANSSILFDYIVADNKKEISFSGADFVLSQKGFNKDEFVKKTEDIGQLHEQFTTSKHSLIALDDIYFSGWQQGFNGIFKRAGDERSLKILMIIIGIILVVSVLNFSNLQIVNINSAIKNIGINKISGAQGKHLFLQKLAEILILIGFSTIIVSIAYQTILPVFNRFTGIPLSPKIVDILFINTCIIATMIVLAMVYPTIIVSKLPINLSLKNQLSSNNNLMGRQAIVIAQLTLSIGLLIASVVVVKQLNMMLNKDLGFQTKNIIESKIFRRIPFPTSNTPGNYENRQQLKQRQKDNSQYIKNELDSHSSILSYSQQANPLDARPMPWKMNNGSDDYASHKTIAVNPNHFKVFDFRMVEGRFFNPEQDESRSNKVIINEAAKKFWNIGDIAQTRLNNRYWGEEEGYEIIGVVKDFNFDHLSVKPQPLIMVYFYDIDANYQIRFHDGATQSGLQFIEGLFKKVNPDETFKYTFVADIATALYEKEKRLSQIYVLFTLVAFLISMNGLFIIALYDTAKRTKEIGIRKVNGARISEVLIMLNKDFVKWVAIAFVIATPIAWYAMHKWLESFAYKTELSGWIFVFTGLLVLLIALLTVSWQSWRAATRNPVEALRYE